MVGASLLVLVAVGPGMGHAELSSASPGPGDVVSIVPSELVASFTQDMREDRTKIELRDASGGVIAQGGRDPDRPRVQELVLPHLAPGVYEVRWVTFSAEDDELHRGKYTFTVLAASLPTSIPEATACPSRASTATAPTASQVPSASSSLAAADADVASLPSPTPCRDGGIIAPSASPAPSASTSPGHSPGPSASS
jgi:methionine-rich copper-binding protein CopC